MGGGGVMERTALSKAWRLTMALLAAF